MYSCNSTEISLFSKFHGLILHTDSIFIMKHFKPEFFLKGSLLIASLMMPMYAAAQRTAKVTGKYQYIVTDNDNITLKEAKIKCIDLAKAEALKNEFGTMVASDFISSERAGNDDDVSSFYVMDTSSSVKGEWLGDEKEPVVAIETNGKDLIFSAEVWGTAREIVRAHTELKWEVMKDINGKKIASDQFDTGERVFLKFKSPIDGYVAAYLITGDDDTACLLPYRKDTSGRVQVKGGKEYVFFDKAIDPSATYYKLSTNHLQEMNQLVVVFSPNPFSKDVNLTTDSRKPSYLSQKDFAKWLLKNQRADKDMVVARKWVAINGLDE